MKPKIPWTVRLAVWWHETMIGHRVTTHYARGKYRRTQCNACNHTFHYHW